MMDNIFRGKQIEFLEFMYKTCNIDNFVNYNRKRCDEIIVEQSNSPREKGATKRFIYIYKYAKKYESSYVLCHSESPQSERDLAVQRLLAFQQTSNDSHVYECLSSSPECDSNLELRHGSGGGFRAACKRKSDSSAMSGESKVHHQPLFVRSVSLPYCGSETESELYAPYTFYTGDEVRPSTFIFFHFVPI